MRVSGGPCATPRSTQAAIHLTDRSTEAGLRLIASTDIGERHFQNKKRARRRQAAPRKIIQMAIIASSHGVRAARLY
jgi:hypothetical protein